MQPPDIIQRTITPPPVPTPKGYYRLQTANLAGFHYYADSEWLEQMELGEPLTLIPEPANPHDRYAVRVHWKNQHIGYLSQDSNQIVSRLLRQGAPISAVIAWLTIGDNSSHPLTMHVLMPVNGQQKQIRDCK